MNEHRYDYPLVYFPITGKWQYESNAITSDKNECGIYWCADHKSEDNSNASALWIHPQWGYTGTADDPAIQFGRNDIPRSSALPIRPVETQ